MAMTFEVNMSQVKRKANKMNDVATKAISEQALKDSNKYAKKDSGMLIASSISASRLDKGELIWNTIYARHQYWLPNTRGTGRYMWAHFAKSQHLKTWIKIGQKAVEKM